MKPGAAIVTKNSQSLKLQKRLLHDLLSITNFVPRETAGCCCCYLHSSSIFFQGFRRHSVFKREEEEDVAEGFIDLNGEKNGEPENARGGAQDNGAREQQQHHAKIKKKKLHCVLVALCQSTLYHRPCPSFNSSTTRQ